MHKNIQPFILIFNLPTTFFNYMMLKVKQEQIGKRKKSKNYLSLRQKAVLLQSENDGPVAQLDRATAF